MPPRPSLPPPCRPAPLPLASLQECSQATVLRYLHHVIWRQLDPPNPSTHHCFRPSDLKMPCILPSIKGEQKDPKVFRSSLLSLRRHLTENLVRPVYEALAVAGRQFVLENRLKGGDVLLTLVLQDSNSRVLEVSAKHVVYRKWSVREERSLHRTLMDSHRLVKLCLPGKADDRILSLVANHCPLLEDLDISNSFVTDKGLLAVCGVAVKEDKKARKRDRSLSRERGRVDGRTGRFVRAAAARAREKMDSVRDDPHYLSDLAQGRGAASILRDQVSDLTARMRPYMEARTAKTSSSANSSSSSSSSSSSWPDPKVPGLTYSFTSKGCPLLKSLDINRTNYPKRTISGRGEVMVDLGLTRDSVLASVLILQQLKVLKWTELGEILQLVEMVYGEAGLEPPQLQLTFLCDTRLTLDKLEVTRRLCPSISRLDISMFNFSFDEQDEAVAGRSTAMYFEFKNLRDLEVQYLDDSQLFRTSIETASLSSSLTRICLNKMISISFETLAAVKTTCRSLATFELFVDNIFSVSRYTPLEQVISETPNVSWPSLRSLKMGGQVESGSILKYLVAGCPSLRVLCYSLYEDQADLVTDSYIEQLLACNPLPKLVAFYFEKCVLTEQSFFLLVEHLPALRHLGILSEWLGLDRRGRLSIQSYIRGNNLAIDVDTVQGSGATHSFM